MFPLWINTMQSTSQFSTVQLLSCVWLFATHEPQHASPLDPSPTPGVHANPCPLSQWCHPAILSSVVPFSSCPQSLPASQSFPMSQLSMRWPKYWSFSFSMIPSKEIPGLISFRMGWLDLLAVQGTLKIFLQHHSSKASILWCSAFFIVQHLHSFGLKVFTWDLICENVWNNSSFTINKIFSYSLR